MHYERLYPEQKAAADLLLQDIRTTGKAALIAGQRGGKTMIAVAIAEQLGLRVLLASGSKEMSKEAAAYFEGLDVTPVDAFFLKPKNVTSDYFVILDDGLWHTHLAVFEALEAPVLLVSSATDEFIARESSWNGIPYRGYATWELNPQHTPSSLKKHLQGDLANFGRDYGRHVVPGCLNPAVETED